MTLSVQCERDEDGRWLAKMPGAIAYGETIEEAMANVEALALQVVAEQAERDAADAVDAGNRAAGGEECGAAPGFQADGGREREA